MNRININEIFINSIKNSSGLFSGKNIQMKWLAHKRSTEGFGRVVGDNNEITDCKQIIFTKVNQKE